MPGFPMIEMGSSNSEKDKTSKVHVCIHIYIEMHWPVTKRVKI